MIIAVDFDGTVVTHEYPNVGSDVPHAVEVLKELVAQGHNLILWTMRSEATLEDAVSWFASAELPLFGINENPQQKSWTQSPKAYCHVYLDDAALGVPLIVDLALSDRPFVDWREVRKLLVQRGLIA
jgi:hypothetical protein